MLQHSVPLCLTQEFRRLNAFDLFHFLGNMTPQPFEALSHHLLVLRGLWSSQTVSQLFPPHPLARFILNKQLSMYSTCLGSPFCPHSLYIFHTLSQPATVCSSYPQVFVVVVVVFVFVFFKIADST